MAVTPTTVREYDRTAPGPDATRTAVFGLGCFWGPEASFAALDGVVRTAVGYAGGERPDPTYHDLGAHSEVVRVAYDPETIRYRELLAHAADAHDLHRPSQPDRRQYHRLVLLDSERHAEALEAFMADHGLDRDAVGARIDELKEFVPAEPYHQKYSLRGKRWVTDVFDEAGYGDRQFRRSAAAAKLHAHVAGHDVDVPFIHARSRGAADRR